MDNLLLQSNKIKKNESEINQKKKIKKNLSVTNNDYSTKKFWSVIQQNKNMFLDINKLLSKNQNAVLNQSILSKKGNRINKSSIRSNSLSNSNILLKSTEENLIQKINNDDEILSPKKMKKIASKKVPQKHINLYDSKILKNVIKLYKKIFNKEAEIIEKDLDNNQKNKSSTKIINNNLIENIEKEKNKLMQRKKRKSAMISPSNIPNLINNVKGNSFFNSE